MCVCVGYLHGEGYNMLYATSDPFLLNEIRFNQGEEMRLIILTVDFELAAKFH